MQWIYQKNLFLHFCKTIVFIKACWKYAIMSSKKMFSFLQNNDFDNMISLLKPPQQVHLMVLSGSTCQRSRSKCSMLQICQHDIEKTVVPFLQNHRFHKNELRTFNHLIELIWRYCAVARDHSSLSECSIRAALTHDTVQNHPIRLMRWSKVFKSYDQNHYFAKFKEKNEFMMIYF